jgi:DHA1 family bicyclomycin/chloramphenicol resistance-like MFS transporter
MKAKMPPILLLGIASGISPFAMAIVVPALEVFAQKYQAPYSTVQFIISAYLFGLAIAQPIVGFVSDKIGRRPVLIAGFLLYVVASIICVTTESINALIISRFLQGTGGSVGSVISRAIIRDTTSPEQSAKALSRVTAIMGSAPMIAPVIGGLAYQFFGNPNDIFIITAFFGIVILVPIFFKIPETKKDDLTQTDQEDTWYEKYKYLLGSKIFLGSSFIYAFTTGGFFSFLAVGSTVFSKELGIEATGFGVMWSLMTILYSLSSFISGNLSEKYGLMKVLLSGVIINLAAGILFFLLFYIAGFTYLTIILPLVLMFFGHGFLVPMATANAVSGKLAVAGASSGLYSSIGLAIGGLFSILSGAIYDGNFSPIAAIIMISTMLCALSYLLVQSGERSRFD